MVTAKEWIKGCEQIQVFVLEKISGLQFTYWVVT